MDHAGEVLGVVGLAMSLLGAVAGGLWWLVWPRIEDKLQQVVAGVEQLQPAVEQLQPDKDGSTASNAALAARALSEFGTLRIQVGELLEAHRADQELRLPERMQLVELQIENHERRLGGVEQAMIARLGSELADARRERHRSS